jgi:hypothetical protein
LPPLLWLSKICAMGERKSGPVGLGYRPQSLGFGNRGAGFSAQRPFGLGAELHFETNEVFKLPHPSVMRLIPPPLIAEAVGFDQFKAAVLKRQVEIAISRGGKHFPPVPRSDLAFVDGNVHRMRKEAAVKCGELLTKARADAKAKGPKGVSIGLVSAYRPYEHDKMLWNRYFIKYYRATAMKREGLRGGKHGPAAIDLLAHYIRGKKAAPGFSNHSNGRAVDFTTTEGKKELGPDTDSKNRAAWRDSWFYRWLAVEKNAAAFLFKQLVTEEWHWDFQG